MATVLDQLRDAIAIADGWRDETLHQVCGKKRWSVEAMRLAAVKAYLQSAVKGLEQGERLEVERVTGRR